jgi:hypothetical protein
MLSVTNVPKELALSEEQTAQLREARQQARNDSRDERTVGATAEEAAELRIGALKALNRELEKAITRILKPEQLKRLKQIYFGRDRSPTHTASAHSTPSNT